MLTANQPVPGPPPDVDTGVEDPGIILHAGWRNAADAVVRGVRSRNLVLLIGPRMVGKSALLQSLAATFEKSGVECAWLTPGERLPAKPVTVLVDDADRLSDADFQAIARRTAATVLAGSPALAARLAGWRRQAVVVDLAPLTANEAALFLGTWLERTQTPLRFSPAAIAALARLTDGLPGGITALAKLAIFLAGLEAAPMVQPSHVDQAAGVGNRVDPAELEDEPLELAVADAEPDAVAEKPVTRRRRPGLATALCWLAAACIVAAAIAWRASPTGPAAALWDDAAIAPSTLAQTGPAPAPPVADASVPVAPLPHGAPADAVVPPDPRVPLHVTIRVPAGDLAAQASGSALAATLRGQGYEAADPVITRTRSAGLELRYYFHQDDPAVARLAQALRAPASAVQFTAPPGGSLPQPGAVTVFLPLSGQAPGAANRD